MRTGRFYLELRVMIRPVIKHTYTGYDTWDLVNLTANFPEWPLPGDV